MSDIICGAPAHLGELFPCLHGKRLDSHVVHVSGQFLAVLGSCLLQLLCLPFDEACILDVNLNSVLCRCAQHLFSALTMLLQ